MKESLGDQLREAQEEGKFDGTANKLEKNDIQESKSEKELYEEHREKINEEIEDQVSKLYDRLENEKEEQEIKNIEDIKKSIITFSRELNGFKKTDKVYFVNNIPHVEVKVKDGTKSQYKLGRDRNFYLKKIEENPNDKKVATSFNPEGRLTQQKEGNLVTKGKELEQGINNVDLFNEKANPKNFVYPKEASSFVKGYLNSRDDTEKYKSNFRELVEVQNQARKKEKSLRGKKNSDVYTSAYQEMKDAEQAVIDFKNKSEKNDKNSDETREEKKDDTDIEVVKLVQERNKAKRQFDKGEISKEDYEKKYDAWRAIYDKNKNSEKLSSSENIAKEKELPAEISEALDKAPKKEKTLEQEFEKSTKKGSFGKALVALAERNNKLKEKYSWYGKSSKIGSKIMEKWSNLMGSKTNNKYTKLAKRVVFAAAVGAGAGALAGTGGLLLVGGLAVKRVLMSAGAGALAGTIHEKATRKGLEKKEKDYSKKLQESLKSKKELAKVSGERLSASEAKELADLHKAEQEDTLNETQKQKLSSLREKHSVYINDLKKSRKQRKQLLEIARAKNVRNRALWAGAAGLITSMSLRFGPEIWDKITSIDLDSVPKAELPNGEVDVNPEGTVDGKEFGPQLDQGTETQEPGIPYDFNQGGISEVQETVVSEAEKIDIPDNAYTQKGDGITQILKRQFESDLELAEKFGMKNATAGDYAKFAERYGYLNDDFEVRLKLQEGMAYVPVENAEGDLVIREFKNGEMFERKCDFSEFEGENIDSNEYIEKRGFDSRNVKPVTNDHIEITRTGNFETTVNDLNPDKVEITRRGSFENDFDDVEITRRGSFDSVDSETVEITEEVVEEQPRKLTPKEIRQLERQEARRLRLERQRRGGGFGNFLKRVMSGHLNNQYYGRGYHYPRYHGPRLRPASASGYYNNIWDRGYTAANTNVISPTGSFSHSNN